MSRVKQKNTAPEMMVRRLVHSLGYRYRLHDKKLPGSPDLVFWPRKAVIFVHGCFWHRHDDPSCKLSRPPKSRLEYWLPKLERNQTRDAANVAKLENAGWRVMTIWECELKDMDTLAPRLVDFLGARARNEIRTRSVGSSNVHKLRTGSPALRKARM